MSDRHPERHPKVNPPGVATCPHCGNRTPQKLRHRADYQEAEDQTGDGDFYVDERWFAVLECATCGYLALYVDFWNYTANRWEAALAYPQKLQAPPEVPAAIARAFDEAVAARAHAPGLAAVGIRRVFEGVARDQGAQGRTLRDQIKWLGTQGTIPAQLADMMDASRLLGNLGAHFTEFSVTEDDMKTLTEFVLALFEYVYIAPAKVEAFRRSVEQRKA